VNRLAVLAALALAFVAGWIVRGCGTETSNAPSNDASREVAVAAARTPPTPALRRAEPQGREPSRRSAPTRDDAPSEPSNSATKPDEPKEAAQPTVASTAAESGAMNTWKAVSGVVVDSLTGAPVAGANIHLCVFDGDDPWGWNGSGSGDDGRFAANLLDDWRDAKKLRLVVLAGKDGYQPARVPVATPTVRVELEKLDHAPRPGRIVGIARDADGKPLSGRLLIGGKDDLDIHSFGSWTNADANGRFTIEGVPTGHLRVNLAESDDVVDVTVVEGCEASIELRARFSRPATGAFAPGTLTAAEYERMRALLEPIRDQEFSKDASGFAPAGYALQQLELQWLRCAPGRDVVVSALPAADGAFVRLDRAEGACCTWRAPIVDGTAKFASIPLGEWRAVLVRPGVADFGCDVKVKAGDGPLVVPMNRSQ